MTRTDQHGQRDTTSLWPLYLEVHMEKTKAKIALAEAIAQALWIKGLISIQERDKINEHSREILQGAKC